MRVSIESISIAMGQERQEPWPIRHIESWIIKNKKRFSDNVRTTGTMTEKQAVITAVGCYLDITYNEAEYYVKKTKRILMQMRRRVDLSAGNEASGKDMSMVQEAGCI